MREDFLCGIDFGKLRDNAAFTILRRTPLAAPQDVPDGEEVEDDPLFLRLVFCHLAPLRTSYHALAEYAARLADTHRYRGRVQFAIDVTGPGEPALEIFEQQPLLADILWPVSITGGQKAHREKNTNRWNVPKKDLKDAVKVAIQRRRLVANPLDPYDMEALRVQLFAFKMKVKSAGKVTLEAQTESDHDDLVLSLCLATWLSGILPLEEYDGSPGSEPHVVLTGPEDTVGRPAPSWREGNILRPAGTPPLEVWP